MNQYQKSANLELNHPFCVATLPFYRYQHSYNLKIIADRRRGDSRAERYQTDIRHEPPSRRRRRRRRAAASPRHRHSSVRLHAHTHTRHHTRARTSPHHQLTGQTIPSHHHHN